MDRNTKETAQLGEAKWLRQAFERARRDTNLTWRIDPHSNRLYNEDVDAAARALWAYHRRIALIILSSRMLSHDTRTLLAREIMTMAHVWQPPQPEIICRPLQFVLSTALVKRGIEFLMAHPTARVVCIATLAQIQYMETCVPAEFKKRLTFTKD